MRSFYLLRSVDPGFSPQNILTMRLWLPDSRYDEPAKIAAAYRDVLERLETISGVESSSAVLGVPLSGTSANFGITVEGPAGAFAGRRALSRLPIGGARLFPHDGDPAPARARSRAK